MVKHMSAKYGKKGMDLILERNSAKNEGSSYSSGNSSPSIRVDISVGSVLTILLALLIIYLGVKLIQVLIILFFAFIISSAALPLVRKFTDMGIPKGLSIGLVYSLGILVITAIFMVVFIPSIGEFQRLANDFPGALERLKDSLEGVQLMGREINTEFAQKYLTEGLGRISESFFSGGNEGIKSAFGAVFGVAGSLFSVITAILISVYIVLDHDNFVDYILLRILDDKQRSRVRQLVFDVESKLGGWLVGQGILSLIIGFMVWLLLTVLGVPFALPLAVFAGLMESIPNLGPTLSAIPAILVALISVSPLVGLITLVGYVLIQNLENTVIVPKVMSDAVGLKPIIVIVAVASGFTLAGPVGALLAVPIAVLFEIAYSFYIDLQKLRAKGIV